MCINNLLRKSGAKLDCHKFEIPNKSFFFELSSTQFNVRKLFGRLKSTRQSLFMYNETLELHMYQIKLLVLEHPLYKCVKMRTCLFS